ncbi:hypothetical protein KDA23_00675 [Candidatus Saccharibacteria bacterium]|nr:hypothetical protein [Candidatus Saccharibacteria bacterium]
MNHTNKNPSLTVEPPKSKSKPQPRYNVEYFHIYTDEKIETRHVEGLESLRALHQAWSFDYDKILLIDNYNPTLHTLSAQQVLEYLASKGMSPDFWAYEGDLVENAKLLLEQMNESKLKRSYLKYIDAHNKYPCSLLTAAWYLTRLGKLDTSVIRSVSDTVYVPADRLFNLLPEDYKPVEDRANKVILSSNFAAEADKVQDLFYPVSAGRALELF